MIKKKKKTPSYHGALERDSAVVKLHIKIIPSFSLLFNVFWCD